MKIGLGKIGKSIQFNSSKNDVIRGDKRMTAGGIDARLLFETLIRSNPQHQFVILGRSNFQRLTPQEAAALNAHGNVTDFWADYAAFARLTGDEKSVEARYVEYYLDTFNPEPVDCSVFLAGGLMSKSVSGRSVNGDGTIAKVLEAGKIYQGSVHHIINLTKAPYLLLVTDPRCFPQNKGDLMRMPSKVISQINEVLEFERMVSYDSVDLVRETIQTEYRGIETLYVMEDDSKKRKSTIDSFFSDPEVPSRDIRMSLFLNQGKPSRYKDVVDFVFPAAPDAMVYGQWDEQIVAKDTRFQVTPMKNLTDLFGRIKYTFCIPIKKHWATGKFWEMASFGIIPFVHPDYDTQRNIGFPEFLRCDSAYALGAKMAFLDSNPRPYEKLQAEIAALITPDMLSGEFINDMVMHALQEIRHQHD